MNRQREKKKRKKEQAKEQQVDSRLRKAGRHAEAQARKLERAMRPGIVGEWNAP